MADKAEDSDAKVRTASCRCGTVQWATDCESPITCSLCHCRNCRRVTGAPANHIIMIPKEHFKWTKGEEKLKTFNLSEKMSIIFCGECGGQCVQDSKGAPGTITYPACFDAIKGKKEPLTTLDPFFAPKIHVNYENRIMDFNDNLPKYMDFPPPHGSGKMYEKN